MYRASKRPVETPGRAERRNAFRKALAWFVVMPCLLSVGVGRHGVDFYPPLASVRRADLSRDALAEAVQLVHAFSYDAVVAMDGRTVRLGDGSQMRLEVSPASDNGVLQVQGVPADASFVGRLESFLAWRGKDRPEDPGDR